ncbi:AsnC family transcriptional regulator [Sinomonas cyclohexanicum]|uniref:AsnC family transcriptional regulator n=1 Tax=Sinomonas cyclohexanicum TaxID=322009 RepID=A0ABN6FL21_SINCY|nr:Lrp/AsnC family transcriptional regulator [Corynebacterium cyclohexanicum]BCT77557.1 AsnC family transcriptional regulator [Corynebacterium cyclohexanicum]
METRILQPISLTEGSVAFSEEDLALLHALQIAPRAAWSDLADVLDAHPATLARRWERMRSSGLAWVTAHLRGDPAAMVLAFVDVECELGRREEAVAALARLPEVQTIDIGSSHPDISLTVFAASILDYAENAVPRIAAQPGVLRMDAHLCTRLHAGGHTWRLAALNRAQIAAVSELARVEPFAGRLPPAALDLLPHLSLDGRATAAELSRVLGRSAATVHRQLTRVMGSGLLSFRCEVAQARAGYPVACKWLAKVPPGQHAAAAAALAGLRNIRLAASTTGRTNFTIMMWLRSVADVMTGELTLREKVPGIELVESVVMIRAVKRVGVMLRADGTTTGEVVSAPDLDPLTELVD